MGTEIEVKKEEKTKRKSNIELLRIICIIMIIAHHYTIHGGLGQYYTLGINKKVAFVQILSIWGKMGCNIFMIITGYFMIKSKAKPKKLILLLLEMIFYSLGIYAIFCIFHLATFSKDALMKSIFPMFFQNWFLVDYIIIYCLIPYFNEMLQKLDKTTFKKFLGVLFIIGFCIPTLINKTIVNFNELGVLIVMYFVGAYIRLHTEEKSDKKYFWLMIAFDVALVGLVLLWDFIGVKFQEVTYIKEATRFAQINSAVVFGGAVYTFLFFKNNINFSSKVINFLSSSTLGVYLIHDNPYIRGWVWNKISPGKAYMSSNMILVHAVAKILIIFIICTIIDKIRIFVFEKPIDKLMDKNKR